jgi:hypothetical protein
MKAIKSRNKYKQLENILKIDRQMRIFTRDIPIDDFVFKV